MPKPIIYLLAVIILTGCALFTYGIYQACAVSLSHAGDKTISIFLASTMTSIAAVLSTNLGGVVGITIVNPGSNLRKSHAWNPLNFLANPFPTTVQIVACYVYIAALLAAGIVWAVKDFTDVTKDIVPLIPELGKSLLGIIVGVMALALNQTDNLKPFK